MLAGRTTPPLTNVSLFMQPDAAEHAGTMLALHDTCMTNGRAVNGLLTIGRNLCRRCNKRADSWSRFTIFWSGL